MRDLERTRATNWYKERHDIHQCEACAWTPPAFVRTTIINVHHVVPVARGGGDGDDNLIALCPTCHALADRLAKRKNPPTRDELREILNGSRPA